MPGDMLRRCRMLVVGLGLETCRAASSLPARELLLAEDGQGLCIRPTIYKLLANCLRGLLVLWWINEQKTEASGVPRRLDLRRHPEWLLPVRRPAVPRYVEHWQLVSILPFLFFVNPNLINDSLYPYHSFSSRQSCWNPCRLRLRGPPPHVGVCAEDAS